MSEAYVDTAAWLALVDRTDALWAKARGVFIHLRRPRTRFVTTEFVLLELADALCRGQARAAVIPFIDDLRGMPDLEILPAESILFAEGWALYSQRPDKEWSLTDCISFAVMKHKGIRDAFTSDHHFEQAGFAKLM